MKKIIAAAVATAFVAPVFAGEITLSGDVEFLYSNSGGVMSGSTGDADFNISSTSELPNGLTVTGILDIEDADMANGTPDAKLAISGDFGTVEFGAGAGEASGAFENAADVAAYGAGVEVADGFATETSIDYRGSLMEGLSVAASYGINGAEDQTSTAYGVKYAMGGYSVAYSTISADSNDKDPSSLSATATFGSLYVGVERIADNGGTADNDVTAVGAKYTMGDTAFYYESNNYSADATGTDVIAYGVTQTIGGGLSVGAGITDDDGSDDNVTTVGIAYTF
jgi:hypothetical protein